VQSRIKQLDKIEKIELPPEPPPDIKLRFPEPPGAGAVAARCERLGKRYGSTEVFTGLDLELERGQKLAVVGVNGAGKTTLLKLLSGKETPSEGTLTLGHNVSIQYFSQYEDDLPDPSWSLLQALEAIAPGDMTQGNLRSILGCFLFSGDDVHKKIGVLSGGERARLKLARMLMKPSNLLILDEPTNHLDIHSKDLLLGAMKEFGGTAVFVSHDREFLAALATQVLEMRDGRGTLHPCGYEQYRWRAAQREKEGAAAGARAGARSSAAPVAVARGDGGKERQKELKKLQRQVENLEKKIEQDELRVKQLEARMALPGFFESPDRGQAVVVEHKTLRAQVAQSYDALEQAMLALEAAQQA
jgi:ATP-binding cassette, subfamily F, member 3